MAMEGAYLYIVTVSKCDYKYIKYSHPTNNEHLFVNSWSLSKFAEDIFQTFEIVKLPDKQDKKYQKRLSRLLTTIRMMKLNEWKDRFSTWDEYLICPILTEWLNKYTFWDRKLTNKEYIKKLQQTKNAEAIV